MSCSNREKVTFLGKLTHIWACLSAPIKKTNIKLIVYRLEKIVRGTPINNYELRSLAGS
jgi:hypothetical protein